MVLGIISSKLRTKILYENNQNTTQGPTVFWLTLDIHRYISTCLQKIRLKVEVLVKRPTLGHDGGKLFAFLMSLLSKPRFSQLSVSLSLFIPSPNARWNCYDILGFKRNFFIFVLY